MCSIALALVLGVISEDGDLYLRLYHVMPLRLSYDYEVMIYFAIEEFHHGNLTTVRYIFLPYIVIDERGPISPMNNYTISGYMFHVLLLGLKVSLLPTAVAS